MFIRQAFLRYLLLTFTQLILTIDAGKTQSNCHKNDYYFGGTHFFQTPVKLVNKIKPENLSKETCFKNEKIIFKMGTDRPLIESDGEGPSKRVHLTSFCIDQTEVSNLQFHQFVQETNYKTEVILVKFNDVFKN